MTRSEIVIWLYEELGKHQKKHGKLVDDTKAKALKGAIYLLSSDFYNIINARAEINAAMRTEGDRMRANRILSNLITECEGSHEEEVEGD